MVWCWQQSEKLRPDASDIMIESHRDQFLRLADAIRVNNFGSQVSEKRERESENGKYTNVEEDFLNKRHIVKFVKEQKEK